MSWSIRYRYDELKREGEHIITHDQSAAEIRVPQMREADAMHLVVALEQAKARIVVKR